PEYNKIPFVFLTAIEDRNVILERKRKGAVAYLVKPVDEADLLLTVELHLKKYMELKAAVHQATTDELTGLGNKRFLIKSLRSLLSIREYRDLTVLFLDLDFFKKLNDCNGHPAGDAVLIEIGNLLHSMLRPYDVAARYGGDEFVVVLPETSAAQAEIVAEKIRTGIENLPIGGNGCNRITSSFGLASLMGNEAEICAALDLDGLKELFEPDQSDAVDWEGLEKEKAAVADLLLSFADAALYESKNTFCPECGYQSENEHNFTDGFCPRCRGSRLTEGRNRISVYHGRQGETLIGRKESGKR
ncbi:MAG TPA: GGDEF domain-containing response regulator, partial [Spirochaetia bacterium]|nr:GGDEF domain-containing response regulator [Spirochaetia bacterium]